jgi:amino acid adenylation domain-containing protein/thioester reductase-like protein
MRTNVPGELFGLTHAQQRVYSLQKVYPETPMWNVPQSVVFRQPVDLGWLQTAIALLIRNNPSLRIRLLETTDGPRQFYAPLTPADGEVETMTFPGAGGREQMCSWAEEESRRPFLDFLDGPLYRFFLLKFDHGGGGFYFNAHHILVDGSSLAVVCSKVVEYYERLKAGEADIREEFPRSTDGLGIETDYLASPKFAEDQTFWFETFQTDIEQLELRPTSGAGEGFAIDRGRYRAPQGLSSRLYEFCRRRHVSPFRVFLSALFAYVSRVTGKEDIVITTVHHGRPAGFEQATGMFVATLPLRLRFPGDTTFAALIDRFSGAFKETLAHLAFPSDLLAAELRRLGRRPEDLFTIALSQYVKMSSSDLVDSTFHSIGESLNVLTFFMSSDADRNEDVELLIDFRVPLFSRREIDALAGHLFALIEAATQEPDRAIPTIDFLSESEKRRLLRDLNDTTAWFPADQTFCDLFASRAAEMLERTAVVYVERSLTYRELRDQGYALAGRLRSLGVGRGDIVGIFVDRSLEMFVGAVGVLASGAAFMPIDTKYPPERIQFMLEDSRARVVVSQRHLFESLRFSGTLIDLEDPASFAGPPEPGGEFPLVSRPEDVAYVIYTSGSTGKPKGTLIEHRSLLNFAYWHMKARGISSADRIAKHASFGFDASIVEVFPPLIAGAEIHVISEDIKLSLGELNEYFERHRITGAFLTTQFAEQFCENLDNSSLRYLDTGGEKLRTFAKRRFQLFNCYGPTECTVYTTCFPVIEKQANIPIGRPLANTRLYVVDRFGNLLPEGFAGELCVSGVCLARGYLNRPDITAEKFVANPFEPGERLYKTGDLVRWLPDGNIEYLGRIDNQVKLRGFRIELGEIEAEIMKVPGVGNAAVTLAVDGENTFICAYFVAEGAVGPETIKDHLGTTLPEFMVPSYFVRLDAMPVNASGKIDRKALPVPHGKMERASSDFVSPAGATEQTLAALWQETLGIETVGARDDFFRVGGHSLKMVILAARIEKAFGCRLSVRTLFENRVLREMGARIDEAVGACGERGAQGQTETQETRAAARPGDRAEYPVSSVQKRLLTVESMEGPSSSYNIPFVLKISGNLDRQKFSEALAAMIDRHEAFRTSFATRDGEPVQIVHPTIRLKKFFQDVTEGGAEDQLREFVQPFDLTQPPLFRVKLLHVADEEHWLLFDIHHIIFDGMSFDLFIHELFESYAGRELSPLSGQYRDFCRWQQEFLASPALGAQENVWLEMLSGDLPTLHLPTDALRPPKLGVEGDHFGFLADADLSARLRRLATMTGNTLYTVVLAAFNVLLSRYSQQEDIIVGTPLAGRPSMAAQGMIGMFVNTMPARNFPVGKKTFRDFLGEVRATFLNIIDNQDYQLDMLIDKLNLQRAGGHNPLFDVVFVYQTAGSLREERFGGLTIRPSVIETGTAKFDITLQAFESDDGLRFDLEYRTGLFKAETIRRMAAHLVNILEEVSRRPDLRLADIELMSSVERKTVLYEFNATALDYDRDLTIPEHFERTVQNHPAKTAVVFGGHRVTYRELNERANRLARILIQKGVKKGDFVAQLADKSVEMISGLLAIMKAGACYVPIDPTYPADRIDFMLADTQAAAVIGQARHLPAWSQHRPALAIDDPTLLAGSPSGDNLGRIAGPRDLAYAIYTSGSTGKPKGVMIEHRSLINLVSFLIKEFQLTAADRFTQYMSTCFDPSLGSEIFPALFSGGELHVIEPDLRLLPVELNRSMEENGITVASFPTQFYEQFAELTDNSSARFISCGGEKLKSFRPKNYTLVNAYGPTEYTVITTMFRVDREYENIPIGTSVANTRLYVLDKQDRLVPIGVPGELCVAGDGLARGYLNRPELNQERFPPDPFLPGERMYRTGDLVRWLPDGNIEFFGRIDFQVKIRGFRIELGEIDTQLQKHPDIETAVVLAKEDEQKNKFLVAFFSSTRDIPPRELKEFLAASLAGYMIPSHFVRLASFPLNASGKVDRKAVAALEFTVGGAETRILPGTPREEKIAQIWREVLALPEVGVNENFFDIGGHSLKAVTVAAKLQREFAVTINDLFKYQTIGALAAHITDKQGTLRDKLESLKSSVPQSAERMTAFLASDAFLAAEARYVARNAECAAVNLTARISYQAVLLTGATGYLGIHLLHDLLQGWACHICLPVRGKSLDEALCRVNDTFRYYFHRDLQAEELARLTIVCADLERDHLGIDEEVYRSLAARVDVIIHSAANVKHYGRYEDFFGPNVQAVQNLLSFAATGKKKDFNHISTMSVAAGTIAGCSHATFTEDCCDIGQVSENLYVQTKLEAEKIVLAAREKLGLRTNVFRVGNISFNSQTGLLQKNVEENAFSVTIKSLVNLGVVPDCADEAELSFVDATSAAILTLFDRVNLANQIFHCQNPSVVKLSEVLTSARLGLSVEALPFNQFIDRLIADFDVDCRRHHVEHLLLHRGWLDLGDESTVCATLTARTSGLLQRLGFQWPEVDETRMVELISMALRERQDFLAGLELLKAVSPAIHRDLAFMAKDVVVAEGADLMWEGDAALDLYLIVSGHAEVQKTSRAGWLGTIRVLGPGDLAGIESLFSRRANVTVEAIMGDLRVLAFNAQRLLQILHAVPELSFNLLASVSSRAEKLEGMIANID